MKKAIRLYSLLCIFFVAMPFCASQPKVGLALGGGGAKGAATIGVLEVIEDAGIKIDYIAGTSIGAIIGGLYASGYSLKELKLLFLSQEWQDLLEGYRIEAKLKSLLSNRRVEQFRDTKIPFRCVTAEENTFEEVILSSGILYKAILASMSVPEMYEPVKWGNKYLVDGGVINNLPVDVVRNMGADIVIAIDLQQNGGFNIGTSLGLGGLAGWFLSRPDFKRYSQNIKDADICIHPRLPNFTAASFGRNNCQKMLRLGRDKAKEHWDELIEIKNRQQ